MCSTVIKGSFINLHEMSLSRKPKTINPDDVDPSVYYYDEVYDDMKSEEKCEKIVDNSRKSDKQGSKYIQGLLETAELRKNEKEIRKFKKYAKDREEAEADGVVSQSDVYITSAYKRKLEEINRLDKDRKRRIEHEEDRMLNTHKKLISTREVHSDKVTEVDNDSGKHTSQENPTQGSSQQKEAEETFHERTPKRQLRTSQERKQYLREVLAKRTVGDKLKEAQERYEQRRASYVVN